MCQGLIEPFETVAERLQLGRRPYANPKAPIPPHLPGQLPFAVAKANDYLLQCGEQWTAPQAVQPRPSHR
ncbi:MAG: hypothetical protein ACK5FE_03855 [Cyanobacteriota bacterium]|jgi:hypothetical protein